MLRHGILVALIALPIAMGLRSDVLPRPASPLNRYPSITLWVWERRQDLSRIDSQRFAVAYLDQTITLALSPQRQPRRSPVLFPPQAARIPVTRIETAPHAVLDPQARNQIVEWLLLSARQTGIAALQVDFDATASQRDFYRDLLRDLRRQMPPHVPLSITALASWCSFDDWLRGLPIDEAVPMMFRMEPDRKRAPGSLDAFQIREPLCAGSFGVSTGEPWPSQLQGKRLYVFPDHGWTPESLASLQHKLERLQ